MKTKIENFESLKNRYISAYRNCNKKEVQFLIYEKGWVVLTTESSPSKHRLSDFEKMTSNLEDRYLKETLKIESKEIAKKEAEEIVTKNTYAFQAYITNLLVEKLTITFGEKRLSTSEEPINRISHAYSFVNKVANLEISDYNVAGYRIDDANEVRHSKKFLISERMRLINDINDSSKIDILFFITTTFKF